MPKKELNLVLIIGIIVNLLALLVFVYLYWLSMPKEEDLKFFPAVVVPQVESPILESELKNLKKAEGLPITIEPIELGKENPYF